MTYYVSRQDNEETKDTLTVLQWQNLSNSYVDSIGAFQHLQHATVNRSVKMAVKLDLLTVCDGLFAIGDIDDKMQQEINLAKRLHMEVIYI